MLHIGPSGCPDGRQRALSLARRPEVVGLARVVAAADAAVLNDVALVQAIVGALAVRAVAEDVGAADLLASLQDARVGDMVLATALALALLGLRLLSRRTMAGPGDAHLISVSLMAFRSASPCG